ncbi:unnamed protein product [Rodentolepis nana]|uniref:Tubulin_C domain-containing protein n=1 Tax=Rodentolepis nana TaxID=102285 RepID=A0A0R3T871_RODNA|nr:unnamed protein product [Rodentolepis nana]
MVFEPNFRTLTARLDRGLTLATCLTYRGQHNVSEILSTLGDIRAGTDNLVDWCPTAFKVAYTSQPPVVIPGMGPNKITRSLSMITNSTCIAGVFERLERWFMKLFTRRAFVHCINQYHRILSILAALESCFKHSLPAVTVVVDVYINGLPIRLFHVIYAIIYGVIYSTFSYFYFDVVNIQPIYPMLDWSEPGKAVFISFVVILCGPVVQFLLYLLYVGRITLSAHLNGRGKVVVDSWWNAGSQATPDNEAVECA